MKPHGWWRRDAMAPFPGQDPRDAGPAAAPPVPPPRTGWEGAPAIAVPVLVAALAKVAVLLLTFFVLQQPDDFQHRLAFQWDGEHYLCIAGNTDPLCDPRGEGYQFHFEGEGDSVHFAFLYPLLIRLLGGSAFAALAISNVCSVAAVAVVAWHWGPRPALALALFPSWLVYGSVGYSEGLYVLLAAVGLALVERGRQLAGGAAAGLAACARYLGGPALLLAMVPWSRSGQGTKWTRGLWAAVLSLTGLRFVAWLLRGIPPSFRWLTAVIDGLSFLAFGAAAVLALVASALFVRVHARDWRQWVAFTVVSIAGLALAAWMAWQTGETLGYYESQKPWGGKVSWPWEHFEWLLTGWFTLQGGPIAPWGNLSPIDFVVRDLLFLAPVTAGLVLLWRQGRASPSFVYSLVVVLIAVCTSGTPAAALPRYLLAAFPAIGAVGGAVRSPWAWSVYVVVGIALGTQGLAHHLFRYWS